MAHCIHLRHQRLAKDFGKCRDSGVPYQSLDSSSPSPKPAAEFFHHAGVQNLTRAAEEFPLQCMAWSEHTSWRVEPVSSCIRSKVAESPGVVSQAAVASLGGRPRQGSMAVLVTSRSSLGLQSGTCCARGIVSRNVTCLKLRFLCLKSTVGIGRRRPRRLASHLEASVAHAVAGYST